MNPLDLAGPQFLLFYALYAAAVLCLTRVAQGLLESGSAPDLTALHAYAAAYLRAGASEALKVVVLSLLDRGLLEEGNETLLAAADAAKRVRRPLERAVLAFFVKPRPAHEALASYALVSEAEGLGPELRAQGLLLSSSDVVRRALLAIVSLTLLLGVASAKIHIALERGKHNIGFLLFMTAVACGVGVTFILGRRTRRGDRALDELRALCGGLRQRAGEIAIGSDSYDLSLMMGVFGLGTLNQTFFPEPKKLRAEGSHSGGMNCGSSTSCSSGSSCGSSCGGGGCGGCGS